MPAPLPRRDPSTVPVVREPLVAQAGWDPLAGGVRRQGTRPRHGLPAVRGDLARAASGRDQVMEGDDLLRGTAVRPGTRVRDAQPGNRRARHRIGGPWAGRNVALSLMHLRCDLRATGRGGCAKGCVSNPLNWCGQRPGKGRGGQATEAERGDAHGRRGLGAEPEGQDAGPTVTRVTRRGWRTGTGSTPELSQRTGLAGQLVAGGICPQRSQNVGDRPQSRRWLRWWFRAREQSRQRRVTEREHVPLSGPQDVRHLIVRNVTAGHSVTSSVVRSCASARRPR